MKAANDGLKYFIGTYGDLLVSPLHGRTRMRDTARLHLRCEWIEEF